MMDFIRDGFHRMFARWDDPNDKQYYVKMMFALISALVCGIAGQAFAGIRGLMFGILLYALTLYIIVYILGIEPEQLGGLQKLITNTLPSYLLLWVLLWTVIYAFTLPAGILSTL
ncbi:MAG: hypothetical protein ACW97A_04635 [Candidatus Thorarchaeota archaeon]|jgi:hypothetical protein